MELTPTGLAILGGKITYDLARDVLGPSANYLGKELKGLTELGVENIKKVFMYAQKRNLELKNQDGTVPSRILLPILQSAYFCEDELVASYLGGVLSSSRTKNGRDDRAVGLTKLIDSLSSYALRLHCIIYASVITHPMQSTENMHKWIRRGHGVTVLFDEDALRRQMDFTEHEDASVILEHSFLSLASSGLSTDGQNDFLLRKENRNARCCHLTLRGIELFCWGNAQGQSGTASYFSDKMMNTEIQSMAIEPLHIELGEVSYT